LTFAVAAGSSLDFGTLVIGTSNLETFVLTNNGTTPSTAITIALAGAGYTIATPAMGECISGATTLAAGASCNVRVRLSPTMPGTLAGTLAASVAGGGSPVLDLTGKGKYATGTIAEFPVPATVTTDPTYAVWGPDGNLWVCADSVGWMTPSGTYTFIANSNGDGNGAYAIALGPDAALWYTLLGTGGIGRVTTAGQLSTPLPTNSALSIGITLGPDRAIWFVQLNSIGRLDPTTSKITYFTVPTAGSASNFIVSGPDGALWFTEYGGNRVGRITTTGSFTEFPIPTADSAPSEITIGSDLNIWFTESKAGKVGQLKLSDGSFAEFSIPTAGSSPAGISAGSDDNLWFTESGTSKIGRVTSSGNMTEFSIPSGATPGQIVAGPDGNLWFTEKSPNGIGRISP
jgi:streptogramin lyase